MYIYYWEIVSWRCYSNRFSGTTRLALRIVQDGKPRELELEGYKVDLQETLIMMHTAKLAAAVLVAEEKLAQSVSKKKKGKVASKAPKLPSKAPPKRPRPVPLKGGTKQMKKMAAAFSTTQGAHD